MNNAINFSIREDNGRGGYIVNPYRIPSKVETVNKFFKQLGSISRLGMFCLDVPDERYNGEMKKCLYDFISGPPNEEKKTILEDCLLEFRKVLVKNDVAVHQLSAAVTKETKIRLLKLHPVIVHSMYLQLFCELHQYDVQYSFEDFGIGTNENFLFDVFYCEDHPHIFWEHGGARGVNNLIV